MDRLGYDFRENVARISARLRCSESFDIIERDMKIAGSSVRFYYVDGFIKDGEMQKIMQQF